MKLLPAILVASLALAACATHPSKTAVKPNAQPASSTAAATPDDPYLWLEDIHGERALDWVKAQNAIAEKRFASSPEFAKTRDAILEVLDSDARIPYPNRMGKYLYNFWQDKTHPRGIWRRTTLAEYRNATPAWETLLDIDALNKAEDKKWVYKGSRCLKPDYTRCLVSLSPGGGDAVEVREFDLQAKSFVKDGFFVPVAKTEIDWIDQDHVYVGTDFGPGSMTDSSYPRIVKQWQRGTPLTSATMVYEGKSTDLGVFASHDRTKGFERDFVIVYTDILRPTGRAPTRISPRWRRIWSSAASPRPRTWAPRAAATAAC